MAPNPALAGLKTIPYFMEVSDEALERLAGSALKKTYPKNAVVINEGDEAGALFIVLSGKIQAYLSNESGRTVTLSTQEAGSVFGELSLLDGEPRSASVITLEPTSCFLIPRTAFQNWLKDHPDAAGSIIHNLTKRIRTLTESVRGLALSDVYGRLVKTLQNMAVECEGGWMIRGKPSHQDLANVVGCSREMVSRIMKDLGRGGYIETEGKVLRIVRKLPTSW
ncbi:CRP/FNR family transcriptional regulator, cyclic AMP receptor protein [Methylomagnum ishizawai]|uniref:CRP/FNR family transcriptional regulator, cyclic AMP receptor protein n=1 Tax=Methylomagnum ishizawai TaxID=1760988 RepID=A0A1Y6CU93_9GAMM|nr:Crp/Fnr family transcriptional regulator [Methylomagnum ishizawai]SMF93991.1 CRP/FNR family transcriptional regulator, cyclic AMP receptor protein [Methylomagnum ishizawai]